MIGAGPSGLALAKHALEAGFETTVFEASYDLGGQWNTGATHSGIWPGMHTNTSRALTAFSDFPAPADSPLHPSAVQIHAYLRDYAEHFGVTDHIRLNTPVRRVAAGWTVDGEPFDGVVVASGRFGKPCSLASLEGFEGELLHAFDYPGAEPFADRPTLVYGNGISGLEIASDLAGAAPVVSAFRKPRYVISKVVDGVSSDWEWYTQFGALQRRSSPGRRSAARCGNGSCALPATRPTSARRDPTPTSSSPASRCARTTSLRSPPGASRADRVSQRSTTGP